MSCNLLLLVLLAAAQAAVGSPCFGAPLSVPSEVYMVGAVYRYQQNGFNDAAFPSIWKRTVIEDPPQIVYNVTTAIPQLGCAISSLSNVLHVAETNVPGNLTYRSSTGNTYFFEDAVTCHESDGFGDWPSCVGWFFNVENNASTTINYEYCCDKLSVTNVLTTNSTGTLVHTTFRYLLNFLDVFNGRTIYSSGCFGQYRQPCPQTVSLSNAPAGFVGVSPAYGAVDNSFLPV